MSKKIRVVKYDPRSKEFTEAEVSKSDDFYKLLECDLFDVVRVSDEIDIFVDDEGLLKSGNPVSEVALDWGNTKLAGILVFTGGVDHNGATLSLKASIDELRPLVRETNLFTA